MHAIFATASLHWTISLLRPFLKRFRAGDWRIQRLHASSWLHRNWIYTCAAEHAHAFCEDLAAGTRLIIANKGSGSSCGGQWETFVSHTQYLHMHSERACMRESESERESVHAREWARERESACMSERESEKEREREKEEREKQRERARERQRERKREIERKKEREKERERPGILIPSTVRLISTIWEMGGQGNRHVFEKHIFSFSYDSDIILKPSHYSIIWLDCGCSTYALRSWSIRLILPPMKTRILQSFHFFLLAIR